MHLMFSAYASERTTAKVDASATVIDEDAGRVKYVWQTGDTDTAGTFQGEFEVTYSSGEIEIFLTMATSGLKF
jgi:hypothetical protein